MKLTKDLFIKRLSQLKGRDVYSRAQGKKYTITDVNEKYCVGIKESNRQFKLDIDSLYRAYMDGVTTTTELRDGRYVTSFNRSPALAILNEICETE